MRSFLLCYLPGSRLLALPLESSAGSGAIEIVIDYVLAVLPMLGWVCMAFIAFR